MPDLARTSDAGANHTPGWFISSFAMLIILAGTAASIIGLLQLVSWTECVLLLITGIALSGGVVFTVATLQRLGRGE